MLKPYFIFKKYLLSDDITDALKKISSQMTDQLGYPFEINKEKLLSGPFDIRYVQDEYVYKWRFSVLNFGVCRIKVELLGYCKESDIGTAKIEPWDGLNEWACDLVEKGAFDVVEFWEDQRKKSWLGTEKMYAVFKMHGSKKGVLLDVILEDVDLTTDYSQAIFLKSFKFIDEAFSGETSAFTLVDPIAKTKAIFLIEELKPQMSNSMWSRFESMFLPDFYKLMNK